MLRLEHLNLVVCDLPATLNFYQAALPHWHIRDSGTSDWYGQQRQWLHFGDDYQYITLNDNGVGDNRNLTGHQTGLAHFAFATNNIDAVITRLGEAGFTVAKNGADEPYRKNVYFIDPSGFEVEFVEYLADPPSLRNISNG